MLVWCGIMNIKLSLWHYHNWVYLLRRFKIYEGISKKKYMTDVGL